MFFPAGPTPAAGNCPLLVAGEMPVSGCRWEASSNINSARGYLSPTGRCQLARSA
ncbi:hypothetical protein [Kamptonema formosum]|uniref:hypothetical protein n=1 Tax=Kamptonema formosum TaxID=331992 RepID=UPI0012DBCF9F|nr:hypothetical protein [Oscillatoria sp. PCC 10802]